MLLEPFRGHQPPILPQRDWKLASTVFRLKAGLQTFSLLQRAFKFGDEDVDFFFGPLFGEGEEENVFHAFIIATDREAGCDALVDQRADHFGSILGQADGKLVEEAAVERGLDPFDGDELMVGVAGAVHALATHIKKTFASNEREIDDCAQGAELYVAANVGCGLFAADVLLARLERQHIASATFAVLGFANNAPGILRHTSFWWP